MDEAYVVTYSTESGDEGVLGVFTGDRPSEETIKGLLREAYPEEFEDGDCTIYHKTKVVKVYA